MSLSSPVPVAAARRLIVLGAAALGLLVAGCASVTSVAVDVASQGSWPPERRPGSYAIERLPSQQAQPAEQARIEAAARPALEAAGFTPAAAGEADVLIQLGARVFEVALRDPYYGAYVSPFHWRHDWWFHGGYRPFFWGPGYYGHDLPDYQREVAVLMRDRRSGQILYETRATYMSRWTSDALLPALFSAALQDFPHPALSPRRVTVPLPPSR